MNPATGTFTTMDTYQGSIFDPTSLHKYLYANANPVMNVDPSGYNTLSITEEGAVMGIMGVLSDMAASAASYALNFYWTFKASLAVLVPAASSIMVLVADSPAFMDLLARIANGNISVYDVHQEIQNLIFKAQQFAEQVSDFVNKTSNSSGSSGGSGNFDPNDWLQKLRELRMKFSNSQVGKNGVSI